MNTMIVKRRMKRFIEDGLVDFEIQYAFKRYSKS